MLKLIGNIIKWRELIFLFAQRDLKIRYRQAILGILWVWFQPLSQMVVFNFIFIRIFHRSPVKGYPFHIFVFTGLIFWTYFSTTINYTIPLFKNNVALIKKAYFPREVIPLGIILSNLVNVFASMLLVFLFMWTAHLKVHLTILYVFPLLLIQIMLMTALALFASGLNVFFRDIKYGMSLLLYLWMFMNPILYPAEKVPAHLKNFYFLNPMAPLIDGYRRAILEGTSPQWKYVLISLGISYVLLEICYWIFKKAERIFNDIL